MKAFFRLAIYGLILTGFGCEEKNDLINLTPEDINTLKIDSAYMTDGDESQQLKNVLLEDFTGVKCVNCPKAQKEAADLQVQFPDRVVVNAIHTSDFAIPYKESKYNFRTKDGDNIMALLGNAAGLPQGAVDRTVYSGNSNAFLSYFVWEQYVQQQLQLRTPVNITFSEKSYDVASRELSAKVKLTYTEDVNNPHFISVYINESDIIDLQLTPEAVDSHYVQKHVLRTFMNPYNGLKLGQSFKKGQTYIVSFKAKILPEWNEDKCHVAAFVHQRDNNLEVAHIQETALK